MDETQSSTLATENQTLTVGKLKMLSNNCSSTSTISGKIIDAVSGANVQDVIVSIRRGANTTSGNVVKSDNTSNAGAYSISSVAKGWYTAKTEKMDTLNLLLMSFPVTMSLIRTPQFRQL